jgi:double-stranded uracil-DNA glycosylase
VSESEKLLVGFPPIVSPHARILILGSMPGAASLQADQYYAHPRNAFWPIMAQLLGFDASRNYKQRVSELKNRGIALWDVVHKCRRSGSLDSAIDAKSIVVNDIVSLMASTPNLRVIVCNGGTATTLLNRYCAGAFRESGLNVTILKMPSTSPANARLSLEQKCKNWQQILKWL